MSSQPTEHHTPQICVGIMGTPAMSGNRGVQALGAGLARLCLGAATNVQVKFFESHPNASPVKMRPHGTVLDVPIVHWRMSPKAKLRDHLFVIVAMSLLYRCIPWRFFRRRVSAAIPWIKALEETHLVGDVRGGDSFSDIYGLQRFVIASLPIWSVILVRGSIVHFPQTYGPFRTRTARIIARYLLRRSSAIIARDRESQRIAQELVGERLSVRLSPDVAFALYAERPPSVDIQPPFHGSIPNNTLGLNVNGLMFNGGYTRGNMFGLKLDYATFLAKLVPALLIVHQGDILLIPHTYAPAGDVESDNDACAKLRDRLPENDRKRVRIVTGEYDCHGIKGIIQQCEFFIGARMHSCIGALSQGVPCVGIAYSMKFKGVFDSVGAADWVVDGRTFGNDEAVKLVLSLYARKDEERAGLAQRSGAARQKLAETFSTLLRSTPPANLA